ncbi:MAG TPA: diaminopimelate epimerase [Longimicrobium sp.]|jgi:diaminopimelate epimerase|nr:diaminopimelate epimerase [Longimicrobium sp.]
MPERAVFYKGHGLGNDYIALEMEALPFDLTPPAVRLLCDRNTGVGSDGILAAVPAAAADFGLRIFNPDGTEAEKSGNGIRIYAAYLLDRGRVRVGPPFTVETPGGVVRVRIVDETEDGVFDVEVEMGTASFRSADVGLAGPDRETDDEALELPSGDRVLINTVSIGNPHCVVFQDELDVEELRRRAPQVSTHPDFARGTNVQFAVAAEPDAVDAWVWERGAGETRASGSSACAVAAAAVRRGIVSERQVAVRMPGGTLQVEVREDWSLVLRGPVEGVCRGELTEGMVARLRSLGFV